MPLTCPHCHIVQADENKTCINCGQPLMPAAPHTPAVDPALNAEADSPVIDPHSHVMPEPVHSVQARRSSWRLPAVIAACLLLALAASALFVALRGPARRAALPAPTSAGPPMTEATRPLPAPEVPPASAPPPAATALMAKTPVKTPVKSPVKTAAKTPVRAEPVTVTLISTRQGRHVKVGEDVPVTALVHGRSATLTLFYRRGQGKKTMLSFVMGSLFSTTWTPLIPGQYEFTATALDDRRKAVVSYPIEITVDAPAPSLAARAAPTQVRPRVAAAPSLDRPRTAAAPSPPRPTSQPPVTAARHSDNAPPLTYYVAAARFPFLRNATVLSDALNRRGYQAVPERMADPQGKPVYVVVTGAYHSPKEARAAALGLQRSGYPAYFYGSR